MFDFHADLGFHQEFGHARVSWEQLSATFQGRVVTSFAEM